ncbi:MAG: T9SS type A sorting domain-containing protein [Cryomorphaceae bacterium]
MKTLLSILFLIVFLLGRAQTWPLSNDEWTYCYSVDNQTTLGASVFEYTGDSAITDTSYAIVRSTTWLNEPESYQEALENERLLLFRQSNDTIFRRIEETEFVFFINGMEIGDGFTTFRSTINSPNLFSCQMEMVLEVVEVSQEEINGEFYRFVKMEDIFFDEVYFALTNAPRYFTFIEEIGLQTNFPYFNPNALIGAGCTDFIDGNTASTLIEYNGEEMFGTSECIPTSTVNQFEHTFNLYPNPANDVIRWNDSFQALIIYDVTGKVVLQNTQDLNTQSLDVRDLNSGFYTVVVEKENTMFSQKLVIER